MPRRNQLIERRAIDFVPEEERHGKVSSMSTLFFSVNMQITAVAIGVIPIMLGLNIGWSLFAVVLGNLIGGVVMALHAVQGPRIGIPQMIQSRAQFGVLGANLPLVLVVIMYLGFFAGTTILGAQALSKIFGLPPVPAIIAANVLAFILFMMGHDAIHKYAKWATVAFGVMFIFATAFAILTIAQHPSTVNLSFSGGGISEILVMIAICVGWQITYGPYVADYSRYLPKKTSSRKIFSYTYAGSVFASTWSMCVGVLLGVIAGGVAESDTTVAFTSLFGTATAVNVVILLLVLAGAIIINAVNLYGCCLSSLSILESHSALSESALQHGMLYRIGIGVVAGIIGTLISTAGSDTVMGYLTGLLVLLGYIFVPWSAVNLTDFFVVRHGEYQIDDIYDKKGVYGGWGGPALAAFLLAILAEIPFMALPFFTGPVPAALGGTDITWFVGLIVGCAVYFVLKRRELRDTYSLASESQHTEG